MTILTNSVLSFSQVANREDLADKIYNISPTETPFQAAIGKNKASAVLHEWPQDSLAAAGTNAQLEGDDPTTSNSFQSGTSPSRVNNRCQISYKTVVVSGTQDAVNKAGRKKDIIYQMMKKNKELRRDQEYILLHNNNTAPATGSSSAARVLRPLIGWYATNTSRGASGANGSSSAAVTDGTQRALTEAMVKAQIQAAWTQGGDIDLILSGPFNKTVISGFTGNNTRTQDTSKGTLRTAISVYVSDFGTHKVVADRFTRDRDLHLLDTDLLKVSYLRPIFTKDLAATGDAEKGMIIAEYTLEAGQEAGLAIVADLTTA
jgi:Family of unknown function (DUF5309)